MVIKMVTIKFRNDAPKVSAIKKLLESTGIKVEVIHFPDNFLEVKGKWEEFFPPIPEVIITRVGGIKHEFIFDDETPVKCLSFEYFANSPEDILVRGVFSIKEGNWFQYLRYTMENFGDVKITVRTQNPNCTVTEVMEVFEMIKQLNIRKRMERLFDSLMTTLVKKGV